MKKSEKVDYIFSLLKDIKDDDEEFSMILEKEDHKLYISKKIWKPDAIFKTSLLEIHIQKFFRNSKLKPISAWVYLANQNGGYGIKRDKWIIQIY